MSEEFPGNSHAEKTARPARRAESAAPKKEVKRVIRGKAVQRKKPLRRKFFEAFRPEDNQGFAEYVLMDMLVPAIKDALADAGGALIDNALGVGGGRRSRSRSRGGYTSYNRMSDSRPRSRRDRDRDDDRRDRRERRSPTDHDEFVLETRAEAEEVIDMLIEIATTYDAATKRDLLSMLGEPHTPVDEDWGWTDLRGARVHRVNGGYLLDLPRPEALD